MKQIFMLIPLFIILCFSIACQQNTQEIDLSELKTYENPPSMTIDQNKDYQAVFYLEKGGTFKVDLFENLTESSFIPFAFCLLKPHFLSQNLLRV